MKIFILAILLSINFLNSEEINVKDFTIKYLEASRNQDWDYLKKILHEPTLFEFKKLLSNMLNCYQCAKRPWSGQRSAKK